MRRAWSWLHAVGQALTDSANVASIECDRRILMAELEERSEENRLLADRVEQLQTACAELTRELVKAREEAEMVRRTYKAIYWRQA